MNALIIALFNIRIKFFAIFPKHEFIEKANTI